MSYSTIFLLLLLAIGVAIGISAEVARRRGLQSYWQRACTGRSWRRRFPDAPKSQIRAFLDVFVSAFAFSPKRRLYFSPDDRVMDIYRTLYPPKWSMADALELETFARDMMQTYRTDIYPLWCDDITLGDLFAQTRTNVA